MSKKVNKIFPFILYITIIIAIVWYTTTGKNMLIKQDYNTIQEGLLLGKEATEYMIVGKKINLSSFNNKTIKDVIVISGDVTVDRFFNITSNGSGEAVVKIIYTDSTEETITIKSFNTESEKQGEKQNDEIENSSSLPLDMFVIVLDNTDSTVHGTERIYLKYNVGWFSDSDAKNSISKIIIPKKVGYTFDGYYTGMGGTGTKIIDSNGIIDKSIVTFTMGSKIIYPKWINDNNSFEIVGVDNTSTNSCKKTVVALKGCLIKDSTKASDMQHNSQVLQNLIDYASMNGTSTKAFTLYLPSGTYYFTNNEKISYDCAVFQKSNVNLIGQGNNDSLEKYTKLKPYGKSASETGFSMFSYTDDNWAAKNFTDSYKWLSNVTYKDFIIDGIDLVAKSYNVGAKGFSFTLCKDCIWDTVTVKNTEATGFGMDMLVNVKIINCEAIGCGKGASTSDSGASGFGIGTGISNEESVLIENCKAYNNTKFGYFFENQSRFRPAGAKATTAKGFVVKNSDASGNLHNYGGIRANDVVFLNNTSSKPKAYDVFFTDQSRNIYVLNTKVNNRYSDISSTNYSYNAIQWATQKGISIGKNETVLIKNNKNYEAFTTDVNKYSKSTKITRAEAVLMIWRMMGRPGKVVSVTNGNLKAGKNDYSIIDTGFTDVSQYAIYAQAVLWAKENGVTTGTSKTEFSPNKTLTKLQFAVMLYRLAGKPDGVGSKETTTAENWVKKMNIIGSDSNCKVEITRQEAIAMLYRYYTNVEKDKIDSYPNYYALRIK